MSSPRIQLELSDQREHFAPGELLRGRVAVLGARPEDVRAIELSILWHTEGKGDEDMSVHFFQRIEPRREDSDVFRSQEFETLLPPSPLSYQGMIVRICWCVRVRVFLAKGKELLREVRFQLGDVPQPERMALA